MGCKPLETRGEDGQTGKTVEYIEYKGVPCTLSREPGPTLKMARLLCMTFGITPAAMLGY